MQQDDNIKKLFEDFNPELSSRLDFIVRLERNLDAVEMVKQRNSASHRAGRRIAVMAGLAGVAVGLILAMVMPYVMPVLAKMIGAYDIDAAVVNDMVTVGIYCVVGLISILVSVSTYDIALAVKTRNER
ncbi:MAG: hypothetical protein NC349_08655 [Paenibacillus sp.]|nr:hypothetical protein [Paenibacillus sp.]